MENVNEAEAMSLYYQIDYTLTQVPDDAAYFHAQFRRINPLPMKQDYVLVDGIKGKGQYVGTYCDGHVITVLDNSGIGKTWQGYDGTTYTNAVVASVDSTYIKGIAHPEVYFQKGITYVSFYESRQLSRVY